MPLIPYENAIAARGQTLPAQTHPEDTTSEGPGALDLAAAAFRQNNDISGNYERSAKALFAPFGAVRVIADVADDLRHEHDIYDPNYEPLTADNLSGYEQFADRFMNAGSAEESARIKRRIDDELSDKRTIQQGGTAGLVASIAAGLIDPVTLASMAVPGAGEAAVVTRASKIARMVGTQIAFDTAQEAILHGQQELRTPGQSLMNIGAGALLTGALGRLATRLPREDFDALKANAREISDAMSNSAGGIESTGGAARVGFGTTLEDESVAKGGEAILRTVGQISPLGRVMTASSKRARILMQELADVPFLLNKHLKGIATPRSAEGEILAEQAERYRLIKETDAAWAEHRAAGGALSRKRFVEELAYTLRRGDESLEPGLSKIAKRYREYFDRSLKELKAAGVVGQDAGVQFAVSYLPRLYDHAKIRANRTAFEDALTDWFSRSGQVDNGEVRTAVADVIDTIDGLMRGHAQLDNGFVGKQGSLNARTLNVPDEVLEPWLVNDVEKVTESYIRSVKPQLVLQRKFGEADLRQQLQDVRDEYVAMRERATTDEAKAQISTEMKKSLDDLQAVRDLLLGKYGTPANPDSRLIRTGRVFRTLNYFRLLGGQVLSSLVDPGRLVTRHGLIKTGKSLARLVGNANFRNLAREDAHRAGTALDWVLNTRGSTLAEIGDEIAGTRLDGALRTASNHFSRITGMASWNSAMKTLAVALEQDAIVRAAKGGSMSPIQRATLAQMGVGDRMLERISTQLERHGEDIEGLYRANAEKWDDREAAAALEGALLKSADQHVLTKGVADVPLLMNKELGKTLFQFKSFGMASVNRLLVPMAQGLARGDLATMNGALVMLSLGALANAARDYAAGFEPATDPGRVAVEAFDRAGFTTFLAEPFDAVTTMVGGPRFGRFTSQSPTETLAGPTFGTLDDIRQTLQGVFTEKGKFDPKLKAADVYRFRKLLPYQNLFYLRRLVNALEGEFDELVGAEGAAPKGIAERVAETKTLSR